MFPLFLGGSLGEDLLGLGSGTGLRAELAGESPPIAWISSGDCACDPRCTIVLWLAAGGSEVRLWNKGEPAGEEKVGDLGGDSILCCSKA